MRHWWLHVLLLLLLQLLLSLSFLSVVQAYQKCSDGHTLCPNGNTCCETCSHSSTTASFLRSNNDDSNSCTMACLTGNHNGMGTCCADGNGGCGEKFECVQHAKCEKAGQRFPRHQFCHLEPKVLREIYGLPVTPYSMGPDDHESIMDNENVVWPMAAYYSTAGPLQADNVNNLAAYDTVFVTVHGSLRNAEEYLCAATAAAADGGTLVIAPWYMAPHDPVVHFSNHASKNTTTARPLRYAEYGPIAHTWRYGADAVNDVLWDYNYRISSYDVMDELLTAIVTHVPNVRRIVVAGHSAGGQYVQRWALLSRHELLNDSASTTTVRVVPANPRSFCFLDARRWMENGNFTVPTVQQQQECPGYNEWEWGLDPGVTLYTPYKEIALDQAGSVQAIVERYAHRDIYYLAGGLDVIPNGECQDKLQGKYRLARSEHFMESLREIYGRPVHRRAVVPGVPHDHTLLYASQQGQQALFGEYDDSMSTQVTA